MKFWTILIWLILPILAACAPSNVTPTPTIVRLDRSALTPTASAETVANTPATATAIPFPSVTPTKTPLAASLPATPAPEAEAQAAAPTPTAAASTAQVEIITAGLNVRQGPGVNYPTIGTVTQGDTLDISGVSVSRNWLQIITQQGNPGWISSLPTYVRIIGTLDNVPITEANPVSGPSPEVGGQPPALRPGGVSNGSAVATTAGGKIVFTTSSGGDLYVINGNGTGLRRLAGSVVDPVVSPDGQQVAFTRWDSSKFGALYTINLDGSNERAIAGDIRQPKSPAWSQDGQEIIVSFQHGGTVDPKPECREFDADDGFQLPDISEITSISQTGDGGVKICFIRLEDLQWGLRQVSLATGQFEDLPADLYSFNPTWDPQNPWRVIYDGQRGLMQLDIDSGKLQPFTSDVRDAAPVFSPDGKKLVLTYKQHDHWEVYTLDVASGARQRLTKPPLLADPQYSSAAPAWSPDGSQIAFVTDRTGQWEIWVMNADGSNQRPLFPPEVQAQLGLEYRGVNERMLNWVTGPQQLAEVAATETVPATGASLSGEWDFTFGTMSLTQRNTTVEGTYQWYGGADTGQIKGIIVPGLNQFQGQWISDRSPNSQGFLRWQLAADGASFAGSFEGGRAGQWCGVRSGQPLPPACGFSGLWQLHFGSPAGLTAQATLVQTGQTVQGSYRDSEGHTGEILDGLITVQSITEAKLTGTWRNERGEQDSLEWRLNLTTGRSFQGRRDPGNSEWCGWRQGASEPDPCGWED
jgi:uncharacterized protein YraI